MDDPGLTGVGYPQTRGPRVNQSDQRCVRFGVIDDEGKPLGVIDTAGRSLRSRSQKGLDLVEIAPNQRPAGVPKIMDFGKYKYELKKKEQASKKKQHQVTGERGSGSPEDRGARCAR